jgi:hypothetical protein
MIIQSRSTSVSYSTDATARQLRSMMAAPATRIETSIHREASAAVTLDLAALYPALFAADSAPRSLLTGVLRAAAVRLSVLGAAGATAVLLATLHH